MYGNSNPKESIRIQSIRMAIQTKYLCSDTRLRHRICVCAKSVAEPQEMTTSTTMTILTLKYRVENNSKASYKENTHTHIHIHVFKKVYNVIYEPHVTCLYGGRGERERESFCLIVVVAVICLHSLCVHVRENSEEVVSLSLSL